MKHPSTLGFFVVVCMGFGAATACGGKDVPPAEAPEATPEASPPAMEEPMDGGTEGTHTMPDGSMMEGHDHHE